MTSDMSDKRVIGRSEPIHFPLLGLEDVPAKVDTGAYRSAIHADNIRLERENGEQVLKYELLAGHMAGHASVAAASKSFKKVLIANSFGETENRYEVKLRVKIGTKLFSTSFTLANRSKKIYPVLLGRKFLRRRFIVDVDTTSISRRVLKQKYNIVLPSDEENDYEEEV